MLKALVVVGLLSLGVGAWAEEIPGYHEYCLQAQRGERMECRAEGMMQRALCINDLAFDRWLDDPNALTTYNLCLDDAKAWVMDCLANDITNCD